MDEKNYSNYGSSYSSIKHNQRNPGGTNDNQTSAVVPFELNMKNNFFRTSSEDLEEYNSLRDSEPMGRKLVPVGYFDQDNKGHNSPSQANTTSRYNDGKMVHSVEFPKLNKTIRSETLYSLKSQK